MRMTRIASMLIAIRGNEMREWRALYQTARTSTTAFAISDIFNTVPNASEIMVLGANTSVGPGVMSVIAPLYCKDINGDWVQRLVPSSTTTTTATSYNTLKVLSDDGNTTSYWFTLRFNTNTQAIITGIGGSGTTLLGIYVR